MILDGIVIVFLIFSAVSGYKKGLATILISLIGFVIALVLAFTFKSTLVDLAIEKTDVGNVLNKTISEGIDKAIQTKTSESSNSFYTGIVKNMASGETVDDLTNKVVEFILGTAAFILIFLAVNSCSYILQMMLNIVFDLPILSSINNIGGFGIGILMGLFKIWIVLAIISMVIPMFGGLKVMIDSSAVTKMLYNTNILMKLLSSGLKF